jgi:hypothetical protein
MTRPDDSQGGVERGAAEELSDAPLTETEREVSRPPQERRSEEDTDGGTDPDGGASA